MTLQALIDQLQALAHERHAQAEVMLAEHGDRHGFIGSYAVDFVRYHNGEVWIVGKDDDRFCIYG